MERNYTIFLFVVMFIFTFIPEITSAEPESDADVQCSREVGRLVSVQGKVEKKVAGAANWELVDVSGRYCPGDSIRVGENSRAALLLANETIIRLDQNTILTLGLPEDDRPLLLRIFQGVLYYFSIKPRSLELETPFVNGAVEGTEFLISISGKQTQISVFEGRVLAENKGGSLTIHSGQSAVAGKDQKPITTPMINRRDGIQWALYYPPLLNFQKYVRPVENMSKVQKTVAEAVDYFLKGDLVASLRLMEKRAGRIADADFYKVRASLYLTAGRVGEAEKDISALLKMDESSRAFGLAVQGVIVLIRGHLDQAEQLVQQALSLRPQLPTALVAVSYVQQAGLQLDAARKSIEKAMEEAPGNGLLLVRYAEILQSLDTNSRDAVAAAEKGVDAAPYLARPLTVLGFAHLDRMEVEPAAEFFRRAVSLDQSAPLPRLGLGLTEIYNGDLAAGRDLLSIAAVLSPGNALIRSYLGKAYYEEKDFLRAGKQFSIAKGLDPYDPTPYFYSAIQSVKENKPGQALLDLKKSMALNGNRAIYRSQLMLDKDLAARAAGTGRVFNELGFQQLAVNYGRRSLETAPSDFSSHRLLADTYATMPRHEIARVSELLQSQLLQPLNIGPVQPQLAESNLQILDGTGPSIPSMQEFHPLFQRNQLSLLFNGVAGGKGTLGNDFAAFGVHDKISYSFGQFYYESDGFRENNDMEQKLLNGYLQLRLTPSTHVMAELRSSNKENGDLSVLFDPEWYLPGYRQETDTKTWRVGGRHEFHKGSEIIGSFVGQQLDEDVSLDDIFGSILIGEDTDSINGELQYIFSGELFKAIAGGEYYDADTLESIEIDGFSFAVPENVNSDHSAVYGYGYIEMFSTVSLTVGANYSTFDNGRLEHDNKISPKFGLQWSPLESTSLRFSWIQGMTRNMISEQTIEPTQVSGFNQFYDDVPGTETEILAVGLDHEVSPSLYGGISYTHRNLDVPYRDIFAMEGIVEDSVAGWEEQVAKGYVYWLPLESVSLAVEYLYENFDRGTGFTGIDGFAELTTHRGKIDAAWFHPSGFRAEFSITYADQQGTFFDSFSFLTEEDSDSFWMTDVAVGYLFPKGYGLISLGIKNLFDTGFHFQDTDPARPSYSQNRLILLRFSGNF
ncbi:MAG: TonB-dependent receptor [Deltaproteobacteria bacterium]|nr:TonB-dependent receptor [Deltaproteobacteria bacterium]